MTLDQILVHDPYTLLFDKETLVTLNKNVTILLTYLEDYSLKFHGAVNPLETRIIDAAYHVEDIFEYHSDGDDTSSGENTILSRNSSSLLSKSCLGRIKEFFCIPLFMPELETRPKLPALRRRLELGEPGGGSEAEPRRRPEHEKDYAYLQKVVQSIDLILEESKKIRNNAPVENVTLPDVSESASLSTDTSSEINTMVFQDAFMVIKKRIYNKSCHFVVIPIVGLGGIGKSTLARKLYEDSIKQQGHFDIRIWLVVSQNYSRKKLLADIMLSIGKVMDKDKEYADAELKQVIYQHLFGRRYVIVVDDLWSEKAWDDLNLILPKDTAGSRVLVTTRLYEVARYVASSLNPPYEMQLLNEFQSWMLLAYKVFGEGFSCPSELEKIGKKVVKSCHGLPLTIVVIAGLLKGDTTKEYWNCISKSISSSEPTIALHCSKVLSLSYNHLPLYLRPCFLYVTTFPEDYEIKANRLIRLWMAEGFVKPSGSKLLEEVAEGYLHDLVGRSLLMASKKDRYNDRIKNVRIHDVLRDFGTSTAQQESFHFHNGLNPEYRRVTIDSLASLDLLLKFRKPATRSVLMHIKVFVSKERSFENLRLLRIFDASDIEMKGDASKLVHLRYLSILMAGYSFLKSISELRYIQTLIIKGPEYEELIVPLQLWKSPSLRHLILPSASRLEQPYEDGIHEETSLQTIRSVTNLRFTKKVLEILQNLRKSKIHYDQQREWELFKVDDYDLINLVHLQKLEKLTISFPDIKRPLFLSSFSDLAFPQSLKKLSLSYMWGCWKDLRVVGSLPNLEVFKLSWFRSEGGWEPIEGEFLKLKHLRFEGVVVNHWEAESVHFPSLEILVLRCVDGLDEIPSGIGEIDTLKVIKLAGCDESVVDSAKQIQADQWEMGNTDLQLLVAAYRRYQPSNYKETRPDEN